MKKVPFIRSIMYFSNLIPRVFQPTPQHVRWRYEEGWNSSGSKISTVIAGIALCILFKQYYQ